MKEKKSYESPSMEVVELALQGALLAGSNQKDASAEGGSIEDGTYFE